MLIEDLGLRWLVFLAIFAHGVNLGRTLFGRTAPKDGRLSTALFQIGLVAMIAPFAIETPSHLIGKVFGLAVALMLASLMLWCWAILRPKIA